MRRFIDLGAWHGVQIRIHWALTVLVGLWLIAEVNAPLTAAANSVAFVALPVLVLLSFAGAFPRRVSRGVPREVHLPQSCDANASSA